MNQPTQKGRTIWEMITHRDEVVAKAIAAPLETKPEFFNPLGLHLDDVVLYTPGSERFRFRVTEIDVFDRKGDEGKIVDYRLFQAADPDVKGSEDVERYMRVFPGETPTGKPSMDILLLEFLFNTGYDSSVEEQLEQGKFPIEGDQYQGFVRNGGVTLPHEARVTEIKLGKAPSMRRIKYWDFVRIVDNVMQDAFFIEMDEDTKGFDAYIATLAQNDSFRFLKKQ